MSSIFTCVLLPSGGSSVFLYRAMNLLKDPVSCTDVLLTMLSGSKRQIGRLRQRVDVSGQRRTPTTLS